MRPNPARYARLHPWVAGLLVLAILSFPSQQSARADAAHQDTPPTAEILLAAPSPGDIIAEINNMRLSYSQSILTIHPALMKVAQAEANGIASGDSGHWRPYGLTLGQWLIMEGFPLSGDLTMDGYRSENWSMATSAEGVMAQIHGWVSSGDELHTNTMLSDERSDIGAGVATGRDEWGNEEIYFVIETALRTGTGGQQSEARDFLTHLPTLLAAGQSVNGTPLPLTEGQYIIPVAVNTARPDGDVFHQVRSGQTLWSIAIYYGTTIDQIRRLNNLSGDNTVYEGQKLLVKKGATQPVLTTPTRTVMTRFSPSPKTPATTTVTPSPEHAAGTPQNGTGPMVLAAVLLAFLVLMGVMVSSLKMKS